MAVSLSGNHPFPLDAVAFNTFDHSSSVSFRTSPSGANYGVITYTPRNTPGFDYDQYFTYPSANGAAAQFTFSFNASPAAARSYFLSAGAKDLTADLTSPSFLSPAEQARALLALAEYAKFANIEFTQANGAADIVFYHDERYGRTGFGRTDFDVSWSAGGDYRISNIVGLVGIGSLNDPYMYVHELGHVFTLKHVGPVQQDSETPFLPSQYRDNLYSIMFYDVTSADITDPGERPTSHLQLFDVYALQQRFGPNMNWHVGNDVYTASSFDGLRQVLWDAGGTDTLDFSGQTANQIIDLREGAFSTLGGFSSLNSTKNLSIAYGAIIENAVGGAGSDKVIGNGADNMLSGGFSDDTLYGGDGADNIDGGGDNDLINAGSGNDYVSGGAGNDDIRGDAGVDTISGGAGDDLMRGHDGNDRLYGDDGKDTILGGYGNDLVEGRNGDDFLKGDPGNDWLLGGEGNDSIQGGDDNDVLRGENGNDVLFGDNGQDTVEGAAGTDELRGGAGNDSLSGGDDGDLLFGWGEDDLLLGDAGNDFMKGDEGNDTLDGGAGVDSLQGNAGLDVYRFSPDGAIDYVGGFAGGAGASDQIELIGYGAAFDTYAEVMAAATQSGTRVIIDFGGGDQIHLLSTQLSSLNADDFLFG
ncbi:MAG: M10 family metallopeptidase C-terminal domain-containing protein [Caulobacterales bacterium]|nr:M10 family metallopeptidase C-terminal domain-containing protein [Caulobacterales bacterium]